MVGTNNASCPEGASRYGGVQDVDCGFRDGAFGRVFHAKRIGKCSGQEDNFVQGGACKYVQEGFGTVMSSGVKAGPAWKQGGT